MARWYCQDAMEGNMAVPVDDSLADDPADSHKLATLADVAHGLPGLLRSLVKEPGRWILVIEVERSRSLYVQFIADEEAGLHAEFVSNAFLEGNERLSVEDERALVALGWHPPAGDRKPNFYTDHQAPVTVDGVADRVIASLRQVLGVQASDGLVIVLFAPHRARRHPMTLHRRRSLPPSLRRGNERGWRGRGPPAHARR